ncbi:hypothetical protein ACFWIZ_47220, partial [Streptomyces sp. NPDC127044]
MNANTDFRMPARRFTATAAATVLAAGPMVLAGAGSAHASADHGRAGARGVRPPPHESQVNTTREIPPAGARQPESAPP